MTRRLSEPRRLIHVIAGPRQVGKTVLVRQAAARFSGSTHFQSADSPGLVGPGWIEQHWETARFSSRVGPTLLILDEIQKVQGWSDTVKKLWDEDSAAGADLHVLLLESAPLLMQRGLTESLAGRFETIGVSHWTFGEMRQAFGWSLDDYLHFGGYPGSAPLIDDEERWRNYLLNALIETTISRDILLLTRIDKPALLRRLFALGCEYSGQVLSYQKMTGQLQDAGNTTTLAHYLELLSAAGMVTGLQKYSGEQVRMRASSPKLLVLNTALMTAMAGLSHEQARRDHAWQGRMIETAVGAHLVNGLAGSGIAVHYWREGDREVDYVLSRRGDRVAIEVKSGRRTAGPGGFEAFEAAFGKCRKVVVGTGGIDLGDFLLADPQHLLK